MLKFHVEVFRTSLFPIPLTDLVYVWYMYEDLDCPNILHSTIPTHYMISGSRSRNLNFFMLKFYSKVFRSAVFKNPVMDLVSRLFEDIYWSKILHSTIPAPYMT